MKITAAAFVLFGALRVAADCGLILTPPDLSGDFDWPKHAHENGIRTLATHIGPEDVMPFLRSGKGRKFLADCGRYGIAVEHELHAMKALLPRELFKTDPELFRMNGKGERTPDFNCCASNPRALAIIASNAVAIAHTCRSTTGRYFYWLDDNGAGCRCPACANLSPSDQAVLIENAIVSALRREIDPNATLAHLAYQVTFAPPTKVKPDPALFLEYAPIDRWIRWENKRAKYVRIGPEEKRYAATLDGLLKVFPAETAQALEYWADESLFCTWTTNRVAVPWDGDRTARDVAFYRSRGIGRFRSFAVSLDDAYLAKFGRDAIGFVKDLAKICSDGVPVVSVETESTAMVFEICESDGARRAFLRHYGARLADAAHALPLAWHRESSVELGYEVPTAYSALGDASGAGAVTFNGMNPYGGLAVIHADGCLTCDLTIEKFMQNGDETVFVWKDAAYPFRAFQHFRSRRDCDVIETWVELEHEESGPVRLVRMDSVTLSFPLIGDRFFMQTTPGQWTAEGQLAENEVLRGRTETIGSRSGVRDAWVNNPSFMLSVGERASETSGRVLGVALCWTGAWEASVRRSQTDFIEVRGGVANYAGPYVLDAKRRLSLPVAAITWSERGKGRVSRNIHRWARRHWMPNGNAERPTLLNSYEGTGFSFTEPLLCEVMDGAAAAGVEMMVLDDGWFGRGKYARDDDRRGLGDWTVNPVKLPHGLNGLAAEAAKRGLLFGVWVEPEMANTRSELYAGHPDWVLREKKRPLRCGRGETQVVLDLTNPAVRDCVWRQLDAVYSSVPGLAYVKWDANADMTNIGSPHLPADRQGNLFYDYTMGYYDLLSRQRSKYPHVRIQACASGGGHVDYGSLRYCDEFWTSDDSDARERVMIHWGTSMFYPACAMACHVNTGWARKTPFKFRMDVAFSGRLGLEMQPKRMSSEEAAFAKVAIAEYKRIRPVVQLGDLYRLVSPYERDYSALMYVSEDRARAVVCVYGLSRRMRQNFPPPLMLEGLDPARDYALRELNVWKGARPHSRLLKNAEGQRAESADGTRLSGEALMAMGLPFTLGTDDYDSIIFELDAR